jgi:hypothetical protein
MWFAPVHESRVMLPAPGSIGRHSRLHLRFTQQCDGCHRPIGAFLHLFPLADISLNREGDKRLFNLSRECILPAGFYLFLYGLANRLGTLRLLSRKPLQRLSNDCGS